MTLCIYSLPPQNPSIHVNSRQELLTPTQSAFLEIIKAIKNKERVWKLPQSKEDFGGRQINMRLSPGQNL